jgi:zinc protease
MSFSKLLTFALLMSLVVTTGFAQKKDDKLNPAALAPTPATPYSDVRRDNLLNGFQIITLERASEQGLKCELILRTGAMFDLMGKTGQAALTQATLMAVNPRIKEEFESLNAKIDWGVNSDITWFHIESPANSFDAVMEILARLLIAENIRPDAFKKAQTETLENIQTRQLTAADRANAEFLKALYGVHPYGHSVEGTAQTVGGLKQGDIYDFLKRFYMGNDAFAVVTGNVKHDRIMRTFKTFFGGWIKSSIIQPTFRPPQHVTALKFIKLEIPEINNVELRGGVLGVQISDPDYLVVELLERVLSARLQRANLEGVTVQHPARILPAPLYFSATSAPERSQELSRQITDTFAALATQAITAEELSAAQTALSGEFATRPVEEFLRDIEAFNLPKNYPLELNKKINQTTAADLQRVAKRLLDANALTVVAVGRVNDLKSQF